MSLWMPKKKPLYAPMLSTFGGGSVRGFGGGGAAGGGGEEYTYNPYLVTWADPSSNPNRQGYDLYYLSPEAISRGFSSSSAKSGRIWYADAAYDNSVAMSPKLRVVATDGASRFMDAPTISGTGQGQYPSFGSYSNNSNLPWNAEAFNNGSSWAWDTANGTPYSGHVGGGTGVSYVQTRYVTAANATSWTQDNTGSSLLSNGYGEDNTFRAGKYLFALGYYQSFAYDLGSNPYPDASNVVASTSYTATAANTGVILCPQHNFLGIIDTTSASGTIWDYDSGTTASVNMGWGTRNAAANGGVFYFLFPHDTSKITSFNTSNYSRSNYDIIESTYQGANYSQYTDGTSFASATRFWRSMTYNPFTETHYLIGTQTTTSMQTYVAVFDENNYNPSGTQFSTLRSYHRNRGSARCDPFSHKLADYGGITVDYDS